MNYLCSRLIFLQIDDCHCSNGARMEPCNSDIEDQNNFLLANLREQLLPTGTQSLDKKA